MLVLGVTSDDKGTQLESLVHAELASQGYVDVYRNVVDAGANEIDVVAKRIHAVLGAVSVTEVMCEAKAYRDPLNMPTWQKFLGKLFIKRSEASTSTAIGILIALGGVNGNVRGSYESLRAKDQGLFIFDGRHLFERAHESSEITSESDVRKSVEDTFRRIASHVEPAYYGGGYYWVVWWSSDEYSVVDAHGNRLLAQQVEDLRAALEASVTGKLLATDEALAHAEKIHNIKVSFIGQLLHGGTLAVEALTTDDDKAAYTSLANEPYCRVEAGHLQILPAGQLDATGIARFFESMFESSTSVKHLMFMVEKRHDPYVQRLIDTLPEQQAGFTLADGDLAQLRAVAPYFPSLWVTLAQPISMITKHRLDEPQLVDETVLLSDRNTFWDELLKRIRGDFTNVFLRGFLYDHLGVADLDEATEVTIKSKNGVIGSLTTTTRTAVRQLSEELVGEAGTRHALIRMLPSVGEPWDDSHPDPVPFEPEEGSPAGSAEATAPSCSSADGQ